MQFGLMFFSSVDQESDANKYGLLIEAARFADASGFSAVWTPERHFHPFGGLFPNPSVTSAAMATLTSRIQLRAGSLISPLHHPVRIAEEWSMVDNLSGGRVAVSFGSGWNVNDFVLRPDHYENRQKIMYEQIQTVQRLWRGEAILDTNTFGKEVELRIYPRPLQDELPVWVTSSGNRETFRSAGAIGANVLTHLIGQDLEELGHKIDLYRAAREKNGFDPETGLVSLMLHTYLGKDLEQVRRRVKRPFSEYLKSAVSLEQLAAGGGGAISGGHKIDPQEISPGMLDELLDLAFERYFDRGSLMGTVESCEGFIWQLQEIGVGDIACLIDFGVGDAKTVLAGLEQLNFLRDAYSDDAQAMSGRSSVDDFRRPLE